MNILNEKIIAHRGESAIAPENTLASVNLAWKHQLKAVEIDIQLTRDKEIVVIHDKDTLRVAGIKKIVIKSTLEELKLLDAGSYINEEWRGEYIPTLREILTTVPGDARLIIEIKSDRDILGVLKQELTNSGLRDSQVEIIAFSLDVLTEARMLMPEYKMLWLLNLDYFWPWWLYPVNKKKIIKKVTGSRLNGIDVWAGKILNRNFIKTFKDAGLIVYAWTVNDSEHAKKLLESGIDGITSDRGAWLGEQLMKSNIT